MSINFDDSQPLVIMKLHGVASSLVYFRMLKKSMNRNFLPFYGSNERGGSQETEVPTCNSCCGELRSCNTLETE